MRDAASFEATIRELAVLEAEHRVRKAKAEADLAELTLDYARASVAKTREAGVLS